MNYIKLTSPFIVPTDDGKLIEEFYGIPSTNSEDFSFAHLIAPPGWGEPYQTPEFDELTYVIKGRKQIEIDDEKIVLAENQALFIRKKTRVRYSNPFGEKAVYISICIPAFDIKLANREE